MKRFIAGAQCPHCKISDTLFIETDTGGNLVACSRCDYREKRPSEIAANKGDDDSDAKSAIKWH